jgi:hypothetical protein
MNRRSWMLTLVAVAVAFAGTAAQSAQTPAARGEQAPAQGRAQTAPAAAPAQKSPGAGPVIVVETVKGTIEIETYPSDAPKTIEHIVGLIKRNFYNGQRVHRVEPGFVVQFGDPQSRDMTKRSLWGTGGSGRSIGAAETKRDVHPAAADGAAARRQVRGVRAGHWRHGCRAEAGDRRRDSADHGEVTSA